MAKGREGAAQGERRRSGGQRAVDRGSSSIAAGDVRGRTVARYVVARRRRGRERRLRARAHGRRGRSSFCTRQERRQAEGRAAHDRRLPPARLVTHKWIFDIHDDTCGGARPTSAGSPATATSCTAAQQRHDERPLRAIPPIPIGTATGDRRALRRQLVLHRADAHSLVREGGNGLPETARSFVAPPPRHGRRTDQPGGLALVLEGDRRRALPDRRHVVADGERRHPDHAAPRSDDAQARLGDGAVPGNQTRDPGRAGQPRPPGKASSPCGSRGRGCSNAVGGRRALRADVLLALRARDVLHRRRGEQDSDGYFWLMGRIDDVINVAGHRLSTTEIESTLVKHEAVAEAAATGCFDPERGQRIVCFVLLKEDVNPPTNWPRSAAMGGPEDRQDRRGQRPSCSVTTSPRRVPARSCAAS